MKTVLLIGGAGFIGTKLHAKLESQGHLVDVIDKKNGRDINDEYSFITDVKYSHVVFLAAAANLRAVRRKPTEAIKVEPKSDKRIFISPLAKKLAKEKNININTILIKNNWKNMAMYLALVIMFSFI